MFKSQEPFTPYAFPRSFPLFHFLMWPHHMSNKITKPFCGYGNSSHAPRRDFQHIWGLLHVPTWLQNLGSYISEYKDHQVLIDSDLSSGHFVYQRYQKNSYADQSCQQAPCKVSKMVQKLLIYFTLFDINRRFICEITIIFFFIIFHIQSKLF